VPRPLGASRRLTSLVTATWSIVCDRIVGTHLIGPLGPQAKERSSPNELAKRGREYETQMIDSTHVKARRSASGEKEGANSGDRELAWRTQHEDPSNPRR